jgi:pyruvate dehydrogenase E1 component alpha subunit
LLSKNIATIQELESIDADIEKEVQEAVEFASNSPFPKPEDALEDLFGGQF